MAQHDRLKILVLADFDGRDANVIRDFLYSFNAYSRHSCYYYHDCKNLDSRFDFTGFDAIVLFWSCLWFWKVPMRDGVAERIARAPGLKALFLQDEYRYVRDTNRLMARLGIQVMFTCVDEADHAKFYPKALIPSLEAVYSVLTGYVPDYMEKLPLSPLETRPIDIGYRSRVMHYHLGDLAREKLTIAQRFEHIAAAHNFTADISVREGDRLYGKQWLRFLEASKFALGTESGASVVDFTGDLGRRCAAYAKTHPGATYEEVREHTFADVDGKVVITAISPRIFESIAYGNVLVLHEGSYSGLLRPDEHFIAVRKDYSNVAAVVERMRDLAFCNKLRETAHRDLIASGRHSYRAFVQWYDDVLARHATPVTEKRSKTYFYFANYFARGQQLIPRKTKFVRVPRPTPAILGKGFHAVRQFMPLALLALGALGDLPTLRRALVRALLLPWRWKQIGMAALWPDLVRLGLLRSLRGHGIVYGTPFRVSASIGEGEDKQTCFLVSTPSSHDTGGMALDSMADDVRTAVESGRCRRLLWDHSAIACWTAFQVGTEPCGMMLDGNAGHSFQGLARFAKAFGIDHAALVGEFLGDGPPALQARLVLRILARCYLLGAIFVNHVLLAPFSLTMRALVVLGLLWDVPTLRRTVLRYALRPGLWKRVRASAVCTDLLRLGLVRCARGREMAGGYPLRIDAIWDSDEKSCRLIGRRCKKQEAGLVPTGVSETLRDALAQAQCGTLVWDNTAAANWGACTLWRHHHLLVLIGDDSVRTFRATAQLCAETGRELSAVASELLAEGPCALQSWKALRALVLSIQLPLMLAHYSWCLLTLPWRATITCYRVQPVFRMLLVLGLSYEAPTLRRAVLRYLLKPWLWHRVQNMGLFADLGRLALLRCLRGHELAFDEPFAVAATWDEENQTCRLTSTADNAPALAPEGIPNDLRDAIESDRCRELAWDHTALDNRIGYSYGRYRHMTMGVSDSGRAVFIELSRFLEETDTHLADVMRELLAGGPCGLESCKALRPLAWAYVVPFVLGSILVVTPLSLCGRGIMRAFGFMRRLIGRRTPAQEADVPASSERQRTEASTRYRKSA